MASDENQPTWRPQDPQHGQEFRGRGNDTRDSDLIREERWRDRDVHDDEHLAGSRDPRRWEGSRGSELGYSNEDRDLGRTERYGQGQSGYSAGRYGDDRSQQRQMRNRNDIGQMNNSYDRDFGGDDRFSGRGNHSGFNSGDDPWRSDQGRNQQGGNEPWRDDRSMMGGGGRGEQGYGGRMGHDRGGIDRMGYGGGNAGNYNSYSSDRNMGRGMDQGSGMGRGEEPNRSYGMRGSQDAQGYGGSQQQTQRGGGHRGKGPMGYQRSDERIREMVCEALADDDNIDASQIHVAVKDGEVTLTGVVDNRHIKREAEDCVSAVPGVKDVQIQLRIKDERSQGQQQKSASSTTTGAATSSNGATSTMSNQSDKDSDKKARA